MPSFAASLAAAASVLWYVVVDVLVDGHMDWVRFRHMDGMVLLDFDLVWFLNVDGDEFLYGNGHLLLDLLRYEFVNGHSDRLWHGNVDGVRLRDGHFDDLRYRDAHRVRYWHADLLHHRNMNGLRVFNRFGRNVVVFDGMTAAAAEVVPVSSISATLVTTATAQFEALMASSASAEVVPAAGFTAAVTAGVASVRAHQERQKDSNSLCEKC